MRDEVAEMLFYVLAICLNLFLAIVLFFVNGAVGNLLSQYSFFDYEPLLYYNPYDEKSKAGVDNFAIKIVNPIIFMAIVAIAFQMLLPTDAISWIKTLWLLCPLYWLVQFLYALIRNRTEFHVFRVELFTFILAFVSFETVFLLIVVLASDNGTCVFPSVFIPLDQLRNAVWYAILAFIIKEIWDIFKFRYIETRAEVKERINSVLHRRYDEFVKKYDYTVDRCIGEIYGGEDLDVKIFYQCMSSLLYAIMIYEDYNRSKKIRYIENLFHRLTHRKMSVGIMQVQSLYPLTDAESIREACVLLKPSILKMVRQGREDYSEDLYGNDFEGYFEEHIEQILKVYNGKKLYAAEVKNLFLNICNWEKEKRPVFG